MSDDGGLGRYVDDWSPSAVTVRDVISPQRAHDVATTLDLDHDIVEGCPLPPLWQWAYFLDRIPTSALGPDGHPREAHFLPPIPNRRRMFAGGQSTVISPLVVGEPAVRRSEVVAPTVKQARTGELLFVTVRHEYFQHNELRVTEEQDLVYRSDAGNSTTFSRVTESLGPQTTSWAAIPETTPVLLFRFSALTGNAHRIHYDETYTTRVESFPALVVHGPLLAIYMAELARANVGPVRTFDFRLKRPMFLGDRIRVQGVPQDDHESAALAIVSGSDAVHATASATF
ncbi:hypothetical protein [Mycobacterium sp.]|uniref:hypothetical protein n=1 Tax=Mycobacterium sp. TaxID=1785 RepID=UPI003D0A5475